MQVMPAMIDTQLRARGALFSRLRSALTEDDHRRGSKLGAALGDLAAARVPAGLDRIVDHIPRSDGTCLRILVHRGSRRGLEPVGPAVLWLHGGGYVSGRPETEIGLFRSFIDGAGAVVVTPDYRLGTEAPYPAALHDCYAALLWLRDNAERLGARRDQLVVAGPSAGGGLTAATTLYARDRGEVAVAFQLPIYPMIDDLADGASARDNDAPVWDAITNRSAWDIYLGPLRGGDVPAYAAPARATDLRGLPPTLTYVGDIETFHDETAAYVEALRASGVPVDFRVYPGCYHGFDIIAPRARVSRAARAFRDQWFGYAVRTYFAPQPS